MGDITKTLFGGGEKKQSSSGGFGALPYDIQNQYRSILGNVQDVVGSAEDYFRPMGLTIEENLAKSMLNPDNIKQNIQNYLNPYRDIVVSDINRQFEAPQGALASQASEAGAFGGSRMRQAQSDLERTRLDSIANAMSGQYNTAMNQMQQGIQNLLGFGGLERAIDLQQRQALPSALGFASGIYSPLLGARTSSGSSDTEGGFFNIFKG